MPRRNFSNWSLIKTRCQIERDHVWTRKKRKQTEDLLTDWSEWPSTDRGNRTVLKSGKEWLWACSPRLWYIFTEHMSFLHFSSYIRPIMTLASLLWKQTSIYFDWLEHRDTTISFRCIHNMHEASGSIQSTHTVLRGQKMCINPGHAFTLLTFSLLSDKFQISPAASLEILQNITCFQEITGFSNHAAFKTFYVAGRHQKCLNIPFPPLPGARLWHDPCSRQNWQPLTTWHCCPPVLV